MIAVINLALQFWLFIEPILRQVCDLIEDWRQLFRKSSEWVECSDQLNVIIQMKTSPSGQSTLSSSQMETSMELSC
jgi:hypothetical protein